jgi:hypothetical protein
MNKEYYKKYVESHKEQYKNSQKKYYENHKDKIKEGVKKRYNIKKEEINKKRAIEYKENKNNVCEYRRNYNKKYWLKNKEKLKINMRIYSQQNKKILHEKQQDKNRIKYINDDLYRLKVQLRSRIKLSNKKKFVASMDLIGCSILDYVKYLESKFKIGMTWQNHGQGINCWHIDHIIPLASFDLSKLEEQQKAFHYSNTQPLWEYENLSKGCKIQ